MLAPSKDVIKNTNKLYREDPRTAFVQLSANINTVYLYKSNIYKIKTSKSFGLK